MVFDQNSAPEDLIPINVARSNVDETRIAPGRAPGASYSSSPHSMPVYYTVTPSDSGSVAGLGFGGANFGQATAVPGWVPQMPLPVNTPSVSPSGYVYSPNIGERVGGNGANQATDDGGEGSVSGKKVKFLCSFGGKILPRPSDGMLRYVGGQTRIISVRRDVSFSELVQKMVDVYGQPVVIKYQLPDEDFDALVSVSCPDDLDNMMEEYEKLMERSSNGSAKLRVFLFSASELDASGVVQLGELQDTGQRYVDAVNGIVEGPAVGITRKESIASAASTQNSDVSGTEAVDAAAVVQDVMGPPSTSMFSPRSDSAASNDNASRLVSVEANATAYAEATALPMVSPVPISTPQAASSQPEIELERSTAFPAPPPPLNFMPPRSSYLQGYVDPCPAVLSRSEYQRLPSQVVYANPQVLGTPTPVLVQPQFRENAPGMVPQQFIPALHMTTAPPSSNLSMNPNTVRPLMQAPRFVAVPADKNFSAYHAQVPPVSVGAGYGWQQVPSQEHVASLSKGWMPHQQVVLPEKDLRTLDCIMCQKALPHMHSDTVVQDQRDNSSTTLSDTISTYHSLRPEDIARISPANMVVASEPLGEGTSDQHAPSPTTIISGPTNYDTGSSHPVATGAPQNLASMGVSGELQTPYAATTGNFPQSRLGDAVQKHFVPPSSQVEQEFLLNKPRNGDNSTGAVPFQIPEPLAGEKAKEYPFQIPASIFKEETAAMGISHRHLRPVDGRIEDVLINRPEILLSHEHKKPPVEQPNSKPAPLVEIHQTGLSKMFPYSTREVSYQHNVRPVESYEMAQVPILGNSGSNPQLQHGIHQTDGIPAFPGVNPACMADQVSPGSNGKEDAPRFEPVVASSDFETLITNSNVQSSISPPNRSDDMIDTGNSLFSNQDPWNIRCDPHFPPPKPSKLVTKKEAPVLRDAQLDNRLGNAGELNAEAHFVDGVHHVSDQYPSGKDSAEEHMKQELKATAEGVAASVLRTSLNPDLSFSERDISGSSIRHERGELPNNSDATIQVKIEAMNIKPEKTNFGFPLSDGIGRLQIIKNSDLEEQRELGSGTFGTVYHGKWRGTDVAIKRINDRCFAGKPSEQERMRDDFWNEAIKLADLHHPNVVAFYGVVLDGPGDSVATVTEYMVNGSLRNALQKNERNLDKRKRLLIAMDVAFGMEYLHSKNIVHFDLKSDNLLVNLRDPHRPICKVGDLGLSKVKCQTLISGGVRGTLPWMAPELLNGSSSLVSEKVDVFSFGIVMWELLTGEEPYADLHYGAIIGGIVSNTLRPAVPENCDPEWRLLMERCWSAEPSERPNFTDIANELRAIASKLTPKGQTSPPAAPTNA